MSFLRYRVFVHVINNNIIKIGNMHKETILFHLSASIRILFHCNVYLSLKHVLVIMESDCMPFVELKKLFKKFKI